MNTVQDPREILRQILKRVAPLPLGEVDIAWRGVSFEQDMAPDPYMFFLTLVHGLNYEYKPRPFEKMLWLIPITFDDLPLYIAHQKFGLWIVSPKPSQTKKALSQIFDSFRKAERITQKLLQPNIEERIRKGKITIMDQFRNTQNRYLFFRQLASQAYSSKPNPSVRSGAGWSSDPFKRQREGFFFASAAVDAYFAHLEHILVLLLPFLGYTPERDNLTNYIGMRWSDKFKRTFDLSSNRKAKTIYEELREVKERLRNSVAHGGFEKGTASLFVHFGGTGAIPAILSTTSSSKFLPLFCFQELDFKKACKIFDKADALLKESDTKYGYRYSEAGLSVAFNAESLASYREAVSSRQTFDAFLEKQGYREDQHDNMDW